MRVKVREVLDETKEYLGPNVIQYFYIIINLLPHGFSTQKIRTKIILFHLYGDIVSGLSYCNGLGFTSTTTSTVVMIYLFNSFGRELNVKSTGPWFNSRLG